MNYSDSSDAELLVITNKKELLISITIENPNMAFFLVDIGLEQTDETLLIQLLLHKGQDYVLVPPRGQRAEDAYLQEKVHIFVFRAMGEKLSKGLKRETSE